MTALLDLPRELHLKLLSFLSYDEVSKLRVVCRRLNDVCMDALNTGFTAVESMHAAVTKEIRKQLPKRESERRLHPLSRHIDILSGIETRMSLLNITYSKYIECGWCCFIPGKVLDELVLVLLRAKTDKSPPRAHEVLMELRDISSMAMEHFEEKIIPELKKRALECGNTVMPFGLTTGPDGSLRTCDIIIKRPAPESPPLFRTPSKKRKLAVCSASPSTSARHPGDGESPNPSVQERLSEAERIITEQGVIIDEQSRCLEEMTRKLADYNHRFNDLADALKVHFASGNVHDRLAALVEPDPVAATPSPSSSSSSSPSPFTRLLASKRAALGERKSAVLRAQQLKEQIDLFRDECKL